MCTTGQKGKTKRTSKQMAPKGNYLNESAEFPQLRSARVAVSKALLTRPEVAQDSTGSCRCSDRGFGHLKQLAEVPREFTRGMCWSNNILPWRGKESRLPKLVFRNSLLSENLSRRPVITSVQVWLFLHLIPDFRRLKENCQQRQHQCDFCWPCNILPQFRYFWTHLCSLFWTTLTPQWGFIWPRKERVKLVRFLFTLLTRLKFLALC